MGKQTFGDRLKLILEERKITQQELARRVKVNNSLISYYIYGKKQPRATTLIRVAKALKVDPGWLLFGESKYKNNK